MHLVKMVILTEPEVGMELELSMPYRAGSPSHHISILFNLLSWMPQAAWVTEHVQPDGPAALPALSSAQHRLPDYFSEPQLSHPNMG